MTAHVVNFAQTRGVILERRSRTLLDLSQELPRARDSDTYWENAVQVFSRNTRDVPSALFYSSDNDNQDAGSVATTSATGDQYHFLLRGCVGSSEAYTTNLARLDLRQDHGTVECFKKAVTAQKPIVVKFSEDPGASELAQWIRSQVDGDACKGIVICPLHPPSSKDTILGFMVLGLSKYLMLDIDMKSLM